MGCEQLRLENVPGDAIENEEVDIRLVVVEDRTRVHVLLPQLDGDVVGHEISARGVLADLLTELGVDVDGAENVPAGEVKETRDRAEDLALGSLAGTGAPQRRTVL